MDLSGFPSVLETKGMDPTKFAKRMVDRVALERLNFFFESRIKSSLVCRSLLIVFEARGWGGRRGEKVCSPYIYKRENIGQKNFSCKYCFGPVTNA